MLIDLVSGDRRGVSLHKLHQNPVEIGKNFTNSNFENRINDYNISIRLVVSTGF